MVDFLVGSSLNEFIKNHQGIIVNQSMVLTKEDFIKDSNLDFYDFCKKLPKIEDKKYPILIKNILEDKTKSKNIDAQKCGLSTKLLHLAHSDPDPSCLGWDVKTKTSIIIYNATL